MKDHQKQLEQARTEQGDSEQLKSVRDELGRQLEILQKEAVQLANNQAALMAELQSIDSSIKVSNNNLSHLQQRNNMLSRAAESLEGMPNLPSLQDYREDPKLAHLRETARLAARGARATAQLQHTRLMLLAAQDKGRLTEYRTKELSRQLSVAANGQREDSVGSFDDWDAVSVASGSMASWKQAGSEAGRVGFAVARGRFAVPSDKMSVQTLADTRACTAEDRDDGESVLSRELFQLGLGEPKMLGKRSPYAPEQPMMQIMNSKGFVNMFLILRVTFLRKYKLVKQNKK